METTTVEAIGRITHGCFGLYDDARKKVAHRTRWQGRALQAEEVGLSAMAVGFIIEPVLARSIVADDRADAVALGRAVGNST